MDNPRNTVTPEQLKRRVRIAVGLIVLTIVVGVFAMYNQAAKVSKQQAEEESKAREEAIKEATAKNPEAAKNAALQASQEAKAKIKAEKDKKYAELATKFKGDISTADGKILKQVKVLGRTPEGIEVSSQEGTKFIKFQALDQKTKSYFEYDPNEEAEYLQEKNGTAPALKGVKKLPHTLGEDTQK